MARLIDGGRGIRLALASLAAASMTTQPIPNSITSFPVTIPFSFIINRKKASIVPTIETSPQSSIIHGKSLQRRHGEFLGNDFNNSRRDVNPQHADRRWRFMRYFAG